MSALAQAARAAGRLVLRIDFDSFLADPLPQLSAAFRHLGIDAAPSDMSAILAGPHMRRYSKAPEHAYDAVLRLAVLDEARAAHGAEISRGLAWLDRSAANFPPIREAMAFAEAAPVG
jgi:hypothetical protein